MFQTEINRWLQTLDGQTLLTVMKAISFAGEKWFFLPLSVIVLFAVNRRAGLVAAHILLATTLVTYLVKDAIALPRPWMVDVVVSRLSSNAPNTTPFVDMGGRGIFSLPAPEAISYYRSLPAIDYGFPSGHSSTTMAVWLSLAVIFRRRWLTILSLALMLLVPLSRLYLGLHFMADVLGGAALGACISLLVLFGSMRVGWFDDEKLEGTTRTLLTLYLFSLPVLLAVLSGRYSESAALLAVDASAILMFDLRNLMPRPGLIFSLASIGLGIGLYVLTHSLLTLIPPVQSTLAGQVVGTFAETLVLVAGGLALQDRFLSPIRV